MKTQSICIYFRVYIIYYIVGLNTKLLTTICKFSLSNRFTKNTTCIHYGIICIYVHFDKRNQFGILLLCSLQIIHLKPVLQYVVITHKKINKIWFWRSQYIHISKTQWKCVRNIQHPQNLHSTYKTTSNYSIEGMVAIFIPATPR